MRTIWKFELQTIDFQTVAIPDGGKILSLAVQREIPCLWIEVDSQAPEVNRQFAIYGTGHPIQETNQQYIGSYMLLEGSLVFHVYELESR